MTESINHVFVYGTLMVGGRYHPRIKNFIKEIWNDATIVGTLFKINDYFPGLKLTGTTDVEGELFKLKEETAQEAIEIMDIIEGYNPKYPESSLFKRVTQQINGILSYVYVINKPTHDLFLDYKVIRKWINYEE